MRNTAWRLVASRWLAMTLPLLVITGCVSPLTAPTLSECPRPPAATLLVSVREAGENAVPLIVRVQPGEQGAHFVALDTLGSPQFNAELSPAGIVVERNAMYRSLPASQLTAALYWWQIREQLTPACAEAAGYQLLRDTSGVTLQQGRKPAWQWRHAEPDSVILAPTKTTLTVRNY